VQKANQITFQTKLEERDGKFLSLFDTASFNAVDYQFVRKNNLELIKLPFQTKVSAFDGEINSKNTINYGCMVPIEIGTYKKKVPCCVTWISKKTPVVLGMQWFRSEFPDMVYQLLKFGGGEENTSTQIPEPVFAASATGQVYDARKHTTQQMQGKLLQKHLDDFEQEQLDASNKFEETAYIRAAIVERLDDMDFVAEMRSAAAKNTNTGWICGLTSNEKGFESKLPDYLKPYLTDVFSDEHARLLPPDRPGLDCVIILKEGEKTWQTKLYDMPRDQLNVLKELLDELLSKGFISHSNSPFSSPAFFVIDKESSSRGKSQLRLVVDYRILNSRIVLDEYPLPLTREVIDRMSRAKVYTKLDIRVGFNNIKVHKDSRKYLAFKTPLGLFEYNVMPMGLATAPSIFQRFMNSILSPHLGIFCYVYLDDIIIFSDDKDIHKTHVTKIFDILRDNQLHVKVGKCQWEVEKVDFLGFTVEAGKGVRMSDDKVQAIKNWKRPNSIRDIRAFAGLALFYSKFIPHFADLMKPFYLMTKKGAVFSWNDTLQSAFDIVKSHMRTDVFLQGFDYEKEIIFETDASDVAYAGIISQTNSIGELQPVLMFSHTFSTEQENWPAHDKELYPIIQGFDKYRHFFQGSKFPIKVFSDHRALSKFMTTTDISRKDRHRRWAEFLSGYNFQIQYRPGAENTAADALSRFGYPERDKISPPVLPHFRFSAQVLKSLDPSTRLDQ